MPGTKRKQPKSNPTIRDVYHDIQEIKDMQLTQAADIVILKDWKAKQEIAKQAIEEYKQQEETERQSNLGNRERAKKIEVLKQVSIVLALLAAILYAYLGSLHK